jgi:4-hydroxy-tetrahydrodipicolinate reductase
VPFQQKIGAGLTLDEFRKKEEEGTLRHVGLPESVDFIAAKMGWKLDRSTESLEPVMADTDVKIGYKPIIKGMARGVYQVGRGFVGSREVIKLEFRAAVGEPQSYDRIVINGDPKIDSTITGGVNGDIATCAITLNAIRSILSSTPGLKTMCDIPTVTFYS